MRKLASIKRISGIQPIAGKDRIVLATVDGWSVIVKKDEFNVGDLCVYVEIDSVMPEKPEFEFLRSKDFRIKTMKMAGVVSQGICFPLTILPFGESCGDYREGEDVTGVIGVKQYEATADIDPPQTDVHDKMVRKYPRFLMRMKWFRKLVLPKKEYRGFPEFVSKTDETRVQNIPFILKNKDTKWVATEKIDGQSGTFALVRHKSRVPFVNDKFEFIVCSRNNRLFRPDNSSYWSVARKYHIEEALKGMIGAHEWIAIQGECIGPKIQKNKYHVTDYDLFVFNLIYSGGRRIPSPTAKMVCEEHGLKFVPIIETGITLPDTVDDVLAYAHGTSTLYDTLREGIVFRSSDGSQSFKAVDPLFLIKHDE